MKLILAGIEYSGTTTLANLLSDWKMKVMGEPFYMGLIHDHFKLPHTSGHPDDTTAEEQEQILSLSPKLKEMYHRYSIYYHLHHYVQPDDLTVGLHIEEAIYARKYYGYGLAGDSFDREKIFQAVETRIKQITEDPVILVNVEADQEIIEARMEKLEGSSSHSNSPLLRSDIAEIQMEYKRWIGKSTLGPVVRINTSIDSPEQSLEKLATKLRPHFTQEDLRRTALQADNV